MQIAAFFLIALGTLAAAAAVCVVRDLCRGALWAAVAFAGVGGLFFVSGAEFLGLVQLLVYVGAVAVLMVFTLLLTRPLREAVRIDGRWGFGALGAGALTAALLAVLGSAREAGPAAPGAGASGAGVPVRELGLALMGGHLWPLLVVGVLLTAALVGALVLAMEEDRR